MTALPTRRRAACIGIEMDPEYFAIAMERIKHVSPESFALEQPA